MELLSTTNTDCSFDLKASDSKIKGSKSEPTVNRLDYRNGSTVDYILTRFCKGKIKKDEGKRKKVVAQKGGAG